MIPWLDNTVRILPRDLKLFSREAVCSVLVVLAAIQLMSCEERSLPVEGTVTSLPVVLKLRVGESVRLPREGYALTFEKITEDSRCAIGAVCKWQGDAGARFTVRHLTGEAKNYTLHTTLDPKSIDVGRLWLQLRAVEPYPRLDVRIDPAEYVATLALSRGTSFR